MTEPLESWTKQVGGWKLPSRAALLVGVFAVYAFLASPIAWWLAGSAGLAAIGFATLACLAAGWFALLVTSFLPCEELPAAHVLVGTGIRMSLPLVVCVLVTVKAPELNQAGFAWFLVGAYLVGLLVETTISVSQLNTQHGS